MINQPHPSFNSQKGAVVLLISIVLLVGVTLITIFAARVGIIDLRISGNEYRHKESKAAAHAALKTTLIYMRVPLAAPLHGRTAQMFQLRTICLARLVASHML